MTVASDVIVVARRWDGLGGRLHAILNAWSVARALDLEFRFVWSRSSFRGLHEPREIFDDAFLARYEIADSDCCGRTLLSPPTDVGLAEARTLCRTAAPDSMIDVWECFEVLAFADEPPAAAAARFRAGLRELGWSGAVRGLLNSVSRADDEGGYSAIHIRAGDIVGGEWRQFVPVEKLLPTAFIERAVEVLAGPDGRRIVLVSDNDRYVQHLKRRFDVVRSPGDFVRGYTGLSDTQRALADILVLSSAGRLVGPRTSAFSRLAAHLGGLTLLSVTDLMAENAARHRLRTCIARTAKAARGSTVLRPLLARDICWYLDVFPEHVAAGEYREMARRATRCEPDFCGALNRLAIAEAFAGNSRASMDASSRALKAAAPAEATHADPSVESLATSISARLVIALGAGLRRLPAWLGRILVLRRFALELDTAALLEDIDGCIQRCEGLTPFQTHLHDVMLNLRFQRAATVWLATADEPCRETARRALRPATGAPLLLPSWRPSGFGSLGQPVNFSQTVRNLEIATIRIAHAMGASLSGAPSRPPPMGNVEAIRTSPSGLRWVAGWAYDPEARRNGLRVGLLVGGDIVSGGTTFLPRPDVAAGLDDPRASNCGFAFPVPETIEDEVVTLTSGLRVASGSDDAHGRPSSYRRRARGRISRAGGRAPRQSGGPRTPPKLRIHRPVSR